MTLSIDLSGNVQKVLAIPASNHGEAGKLSQKEYERVNTLLETLTDSDWQRPTHCTEWTVRDMVAHLAGSVTGSTSFTEFKRQNLSNPYLKKHKNSVDGTNEFQIKERESKTPKELIAEFRRNGQIAVSNRQRLPWLIRKIHLPMGVLGFTSFEYLFDVIYPRDQWMHRYDICATTGNKMLITPEHDGRIVDLVLRDIGIKLQKTIGNRTINLKITGALTGEYQFGNNLTPDCTIVIDFFDFNLRASGRISADKASENANITGDMKVATWFLQNSEAVY
jgi:uncharacterized protein (TIGR03083 family)